jgi:hypothetical protein
METVWPGPAEGHVTPVLRVNKPKKSIVRSARDRSAAKRHQLKVISLIVQDQSNLLKV